MTYNRIIHEKFHLYVHHEANPVESVKITYGFINSDVLNKDYTYDEVHEYLSYLRNSFSSLDVLSNIRKLCSYPEVVASFRKSILEDKVFKYIKRPVSGMNDSEVIAIFYQDIYLNFEF